MNIFEHDPDNTWIVDYECDSLAARYDPDVRVYLTGIMNVATGEYEIHQGLHVPTGTLVFHNAAFDLSVLRTRGYDVTDIFCTMVASHTLRPASAEEHSLDALTGNKMDLRAALSAYVDLSKVRKGDEYTLYGHSSEIDQVFCEYLHRDLECTRNLYLRLAEEYATVREDTLSLLLNTNIPYVRLIVDMQQGIRMDYQPEVEQQLHLAQTQAIAEIHSVVYALGDATVYPANRVIHTKGPKSNGPFCKLTPFNPGSSKQVATVLKSLYGWVPDTFTAKGAACVSTEVMEKLDYPLVTSLLDYSKASKLLTFCETLKEHKILYCVPNQSCITPLPSWARSIKSSRSAGNAGMRASRESSAPRITSSVMGLGFLRLAVVVILGTPAPKIYPKVTFLAIFLGMS